MSVSPFPPGQQGPIADVSSQQAAAVNQSYPQSGQAYSGHSGVPSTSHTPTRSVDEPFSSAAAYRSNMTPVSSPPPRPASSQRVPPSQVQYERASALQSPPPASSLVIHDPAATSSSSSPAPHGAPTITSAAHSTNAADARSAKLSAPNSSKRDGTASISKSARSGATSWFIGGPNSFIAIPSRYAFSYILITAIQAIVVITLVAFIFARIVTQVDDFTQDLKTVSVYLAVFVFGCVFQVLIAWDAVRLKNTMQLIGVLIFNIALTVTAGIEIRQVRDALDAQVRIKGGIPCLDNPDQLCPANSLFPSVKIYLIAVAAVCFASEIIMIFLSFKLWKEFGWIIYQKIGADLKIRNMFFRYQLFIVFLKFSFFLGVGFTVIYLILVADTHDWAYGVTIAAVPIAIVALFAAGFAVRREWSSLMVLSLFLMIVGMVYFAYKVTQVWVPSTRQEYTYVHTTITFISAFAILSLTLTLINGIICLLNFHKGLKPAHDAIGTFGGVHRQRNRGVSEGNVLDLEEPNAESKDDLNGMPTHLPPHRASVVSNGFADPRRGSAGFVNGGMQSPSHVYGSNGAAVPVMADRRTSQPYVPPPMAATLSGAPVLAPQPIPAAVQPHGYVGSPQAQVPPQQAYHPQSQEPSQAYLAAHQPRPSASRISLD